MRCNMKKDIVLICLVFVLCLLTSCTQSENPDGTNADQGTSYSYNENAPDFSKGENNSENPSVLQYDFSLSDQLKNSRIDQVYPISSTQFYILYFSDTQYYLGFFDSAQNAVKNTVVLASTETAMISGYLQGENICIEVNEMVLSGADIKQRSSVFRIYDQNLEKLFELDTNKIAPFGITAFGVNPDLEKIAYQTYKDNQNVLCVNNVECTAPQYVTFDGQIDSIQTLSFINENSVAFVGIKNNEDIFGTINFVDGSISTYRHSGISDRIFTSSPKILFSDKKTEINQNSSGIVYTLNREDLKLSKIPLIDSNESQNAYLSCEGDFIITCLVGKQQDGNAAYRYRVYEAASGKMINEFDRYVNSSIEQTDVQYISGDASDNRVTVIYRLNGTAYMEQYQLKKS